MGLLLEIIMSDNQTGSDLSIHERIAASLEPQAEVSQETEVEEAQEELAENTDIETVEVEEEVDTSEELEETDLEVDTPETAEDEQVEDSEAPRFESIDDLAEALEMPVDDFLQSIKGKFKVNGEEGEVSLAEAFAGYQKDADYRHKTTELADQRKAFEEQTQQANSQLQERLTQADNLIENLNNQLMAEFQSVNWEELRTTNPGEYSARLSEFQGRQTQINQAQEETTQESSRIAQEQQAKQQAQYKELVTKETQLLNEAIPAWADSSVAKAEQAELSQFLANEGFSQQEIANAADHRILKLAYKAMKVDAKVQKVDIAKIKVKKLPKLVKPSAKQNQQTQKAKQKAKLMKRVKNGDQNALRSVLRDRM